MEKECIGLLIYDTDFDEFAWCVGEELKKSPPENIKVVRYTGEKNYPGFQSLPYNNTSPLIDFTNEFIEKEGEERYEHLRMLDRNYAREHIFPWIKKQALKYNANYVIDLHDCPSDISNEIDVSCGCFILNKEMRKTLDGFRDEAIDFFYENNIRVNELREALYRKPGYFHVVEVRLFYNKKDILQDNTFINDAAFVATHLSKYINEDLYFQKVLLNI